MDAKFRSFSRDFIKVWCREWWGKVWRAKEEGHSRDSDENEDVDRIFPIRRDFNQTFFSSY